MEWKEMLGTGSVLALLKPQLLFFYDWTKGNRTLETHWYNSTETTFSSNFILPVWVSKIPFLGVLQETHPPEAIGRAEALSPPLTVRGNQTYGHSLPWKIAGNLAPCPLQSLLWTQYRGSTLKLPGHAFRDYIWPRVRFICGSQDIKMGTLERQVAKGLRVWKMSLQVMLLVYTFLGSPLSSISLLLIAWNSG